MKMRLRSLIVFNLLVLVALAGSIANAQSAPPPIDTATLQADLHGTSMIIGSVRVPFAGASAFCAPAIPYTEWYFGSWRDYSTPVMYDSRLIPYTHRTTIAENGAFIFANLSPDEYIVWISSDRNLDILTWGPPGPNRAGEVQIANDANYVKHVIVGRGAGTGVF